MIPHDAFLKEYRNPLQSLQKSKISISTREKELTLLKNLAKSIQLYYFNYQYPEEASTVAIQYPVSPYRSHHSTKSSNESSRFFPSLTINTQSPKYSSSTVLRSHSSSSGSLHSLLSSTSSLSHYKPQPSPSVMMSIFTKEYIIHLYAWEWMDYEYRVPLPNQLNCYSSLLNFHMPKIPSKLTEFPAVLFCLLQMRYT